MKKKKWEKESKVRKKKKVNEAKKYTWALREVKTVYIYQEKDVSLEVNTAILEAFWISQLRKLNLLSDTKLYLNQNPLWLICGEW